jgi:hypothetical protein
LGDVFICIILLPYFCGFSSYIQYPTVVSSVDRCNRYLVSTGTGRGKIRHLPLPVLLEKSKLNRKKEIYQILIIVIDKTAFLEPDCTRFCLVFTYLNFAAMIFSQSRVVCLASNPQIWRTRSLYLCPPVTRWPSYTPGHWVTFLSPSTALRAAVEVL